MFQHCGKCLCYKCLYYWSARCPHGICYDDYRAKYDPHPVDPPRKLWSSWDLPGEQEHWCRAGTFRILDNPEECDSYVEYTGQTVQSCLKVNVVVFQDGYISCSLLENFGCERCYGEWEERNDQKI